MSHSSAEEDEVVPGVQGLDILDQEEAEAAKAGRGRPPADPESGPRDKQVNIMFTKDELDRIDSAMIFLGGSRADLIRKCVLNSSLLQYALERVDQIRSA
jgi:hypothetical protein